MNPHDFNNPSNPLSPLNPISPANPFSPIYRQSESKSIDPMPNPGAANIGMAFSVVLLTTLIILILLALFHERK